MLKNKTVIEIINEIQNELNKNGYSFVGYAWEGADIGLNIYINKKRTWEL